MRLEENFSNSFNYALKLTEDFGRLFILIILSIIPIVDFIVLGYVARVVKESPRSSSPPPLEKYVELWVEGAKIVVVGIIYTIIPLLLIAAAFLPFFFPYPLWTFFGFLGIVILFLALIFEVIGMVHMIKTESFENAFNFRRILSIIESYGWGRYLLWLIMVYVVLLIVGALGSIPYVGWIISMILSPFIGVFLGRSAALVYEEGAVPPPPGAPPA